MFDKKQSLLVELIYFSCSPRQHSFSPFDVDDRKMFPSSLIASAYKSTSGNNALVEEMQRTTPIRSKSEISVFRDEAERLGAMLK